MMKYLCYSKKQFSLVVKQLHILNILCAIFFRRLTYVRYTFYFDIICIKNAGKVLIKYENRQFKNKDFFSLNRERVK